MNFTREQIESWGPQSAELLRRALDVPAERPSVAPPAPDESEEDFQARVIAYAESRGWLVYHPYRSLKSKEGYPDLTMVRPKIVIDAWNQKFARVIFAELKSETGKERMSQTEWRKALEAVGGTVEAYLWRPSDWPAIEKLLA